MPAGLADGLGPGSVLSDSEFAPVHRFPRIHYLMDLGLLLNSNKYMKRTLQCQYENPFMSNLYRLMSTCVVKVLFGTILLLLKITYPKITLTLELKV
jgi:hypothetical protein